MAEEEAPVEEGHDAAEEHDRLAGLHAAGLLTDDELETTRSRHTTSLPRRHDDDPVD